MSDVLQNLILELRKSKPSFVPRLSEQGIVSVWENVSDFIEKQMVNRKGVAIQGLGVFSFAVKTIDIGNNRRISLQRPVFLLSEKFSGTHCIHYPKQHTPGQIPVLALNYTILSNDSPFDRDTVEMCVKEILHALSHVVNAGKPVEFPFLGIGKLVISDGRAKMKFFRDFIRQLDCSGQMEGAFHQRSSTSMSNGGLRSEASIISNPTPLSSRPGSMGSLVLPRIVGPSNSNSLDLMTNGTRFNPSMLSPKKPVMPPISEYSPKDNGYPQEDEPKTARNRSSQDCTCDPTVSCAANANMGGHCACSPSSSCDSPREQTPQSFVISGQNTDTLTTTDESVQSYLLSENSEQVTPRPFSCSHLVNPRQEQCYVCHQRAMRNIPVSYTEERRRQELLESKLLQDYLQRKDLLDIAKDQTAKLNHREHSKKVAAFNLSMAGSKNSQRNAGNKEFHPSYVFQHRSVTPPHSAKQSKYCAQLDQQVGSKMAHHKEVKKREEEKDRLEKILVAKELERDHQEYTRRKNQQMEEYREALAEQVRFKTPPSSSWEIDSVQPIFGIKDMTAEKLAENKQRARQLLRDQLEMVKQKQHLNELRAKECKDEETDMLKRTKQDLTEEYQMKLRYGSDVRKSLDDSWKQNISMKLEKESEEKQHAEEPSLRLHQQCDKYRRCNKCKRAVHNKGQSNLFKESRYVPGARLMV